MPDEFDQNTAAQRHNAIISEAQRIRDGLTKDVIDYYYNDPVSQDEETTKNQGMRKYLQIARDDIDYLIKSRKNKEIPTWHMCKNDLTFRIFNQTRKFVNGNWNRISKMAISLQEKKTLSYDECLTIWRNEKCKKKVKNLEYIDSRWILKMF